MKNKSTLVSMVFATGSVVALVMILGNLESPSPSPSKTTTVVLPAGPTNGVALPAAQAEVVTQGTSYEYDFEEDDEEDDDDNDKDDNKHNRKSKNNGRSTRSLPSTVAPSTSIPATPSIPSATSALDSIPIQQNPKQSTTQAS